MKMRLFTIPDLLTLASLRCGWFAVVSALVLRHDLALAFSAHARRRRLRLIADGFAARLLQVPFGHRRSAGFALRHGFVRIRFRLVLFVLWNDAPADAEAWLRYGGSVLCFVVAAFSALRLAKFNIDENAAHRILRSAPLRPMRCSSLHWVG